MKRTATVVLLGGLIALVGCASAPLTAQEMAVRILRKSDAPAACKELGKVTALGKGGFISEEGLQNSLKRAAAMKGGDTVTWDKQDPPIDGGSVYGTAYKCN